jgi:hypothetical protein
MGMFTMLVVILMTVSMTFVAEAMAQMQARQPAGQRPPPTDAATPREGEKTIEGQVRSINPALTEITLTDGTRLVAPPGSTIRPGVLSEGATVIASYMEENGKKVLTGLEMKEPSASPPTGPRSPSGPSTAPPSGSPKRY